MRYGCKVSHATRWSMSKQENPNTDDKTRLHRRIETLLRTLEYRASELEMCSKNACNLVRYYDDELTVSQVLLRAQNLNFAATLTRSATKIAGASSKPTSQAAEYLVADVNAALAGISGFHANERETIHHIREALAALQRNLYEMGSA